MRNIIGGAIVAFSMYSHLPMPHIEWTDRNMKYAVCYFPLIGIVIGMAQFGWFYAAQALHMTDNLRAAVMVVLPIVITGGIHMDGFLDTSDALSSWQDREAKLEIMKDSHAGAFAVISGLCYFALSFGVFSQAEGSDLLLLGTIPVMSRALSALALVKFPKAKNTGLLRTFSDAAANGVVTRIMIIILLLIAGVMIGSEGIKGCTVFLTGCGVFAYYYQMCRAKFGGTTGDVAGWFVQMCELICAFVCVAL